MTNFDLFFFAPDTSMAEKLQQLFHPLSLPCAPSPLTIANRGG
jgi:hypothetical protein